MEDKELQLKQDAEKLLKKCKHVIKIIIKSLILNLIVIICEVWCIYNLFEIKNNGFKYFTKSFCIFCLILASFVGLRSFHYIIQSIKQLIDIILMQYCIKKFIK